MNYPKRLMGWVLGANESKAHEVRLRHEPNLFDENAYVVVRISGEVDIPLHLLMDPDRVKQVICVGWEQPKRHVWVGFINFYNGETIREGDYLIVNPHPYEEHQGEYLVWSELGGYNLWLKAIPDNIR